MKSMTGYGKGEWEENGRKITIELKGVNNRYLDLNVRLPRALSFVEMTARKEITKRIGRGRIEVNFNYINFSDDEKSVILDKGLLKGYLNAAQEVKELMGTCQQLPLENILRFPDVVKVQSEENDEELEKITLKALSLALDNFDQMREKEGENLKKDIESRVEILSTKLEEIKMLAPNVHASYREKLTLRMEEILKGIEIDQNKLLTEVAFFSDKASIDEEITRLSSHFKESRKILQSKEQVGKKLDFIVQEFNRETNTICSKANDVKITSIALLMKNEIEKIREQVQNLE